MWGDEIQLMFLFQHIDTYMWCNWSAISNTSTWCVGIFISCIILAFYFMFNYSCSIQKGTTHRTVTIPKTTYMLREVSYSCRGTLPPALLITLFTRYFMFCSCHNTLLLLYQSQSHYLPGSHVVLHNSFRERSCFRCYDYDYYFLKAFNLINQLSRKIHYYWIKGSIIDFLRRWKLDVVLKINDDLGCAVVVRNISLLVKFITSRVRRIVNGRQRRLEMIPWHASAFIINGYSGGMRTTHDDDYCLRSRR